MQRGVIVGCGAMGKCHGDAYSKIENASIIAVVDTDQAKGEALAEQLHCKWVASLEELKEEQVASWGMPRGFAEGGLRSSLEVIGENAMVYSDNTGSFVLTDHEGAKEYPMEGYDGYEAELRYFVECCEQGTSPERVCVDSVEVSLEVAHAVSGSIEEQKIIRLDKE